MLADAAHAQAPIIFVARDDARLASLEAGLKCINPKLDMWVLPAWDCLPFDRLSPQVGLVGRRIETLACLCAGDAPSILLTTINAIVQKLPPADYFNDSSLVITQLARIARPALLDFCLIMPICEPTRFVKPVNLLFGGVLLMSFRRDIAIRCDWIFSAMKLKQYVFLMLPRNEVLGDLIG